MQLRAWTMLIVSVGIGSGSRAVGQDVGSELLQYLKSNITNFSPNLWPSLDPNQAVTVALSSQLYQITSVSSEKQSVKLTAMHFATWDEERLVWEPAKFGGIFHVDWVSQDLWFPVVYIYNGMGENQLLGAQFPSYITSVSANKSVVSTTWRSEWEFSCEFDMSRFPFDRHTCDMELFVSDQGHGFDKVLLVKGSRLHRSSLEYNERAVYSENSEWRLLNVSTFVRNNYYEMFKNLPRVQVSTYVMRLEIERVSTYYMLNVVTPLMLLTLLQVLGFFVPVESGEKLGFGITIMLSYTVFLLLLDGILPKSQSIPAVASFITAAMVLSTTSLLLTLLIIRFHFAPETSPMLPCLRCVFVSCLGRLLCSRRTDKRTRPEGDSDNRDSSATSRERRSDWKVAAIALERLMAIIGCLLTVAVFTVFMLKPLLL